ncbi:hypothetical protein AXG93_1881s1370 [Marchantia polymorpha subsp. ruderalis]|uniref:LOB domain-containing protein n=1 Tax=Marchantia polymorpha subsp. ruderalis TaxID=1480154 RepID=A0A176W5Z3_MARPO|nr:hypothetical protein AXG93_1881s1370 [Marchantia polymorpha subsp. ruderalis]
MLLEECFCKLELTWNSTEYHGKDEKHDHEDDHKYRSDADRHVGDHDKDGRHPRSRDGKRKQEEGSDCASKWNKGRNSYKPADGNLKTRIPASMKRMKSLRLTVFVEASSAYDEQAAPVSATLLVANQPVACGGGYQPLKFANVHRIFGASNVTKILQDLPESSRADAVTSLAFEAEARMKDPVYGCSGAISLTQTRILELQAEIQELVDQVHHLEEKKPMRLT